jgi:membrane protease YdiL (CAAX protease family)
MFGNEFPVPWAYIILSSIAGWFYGLAYIRTGSILAPAILHAMVDGWWVYFFNPN